MLKVGMVIFLALLVQCSSDSNHRNVRQTFTCSDQEDCLPDRFRNSSTIVPPNLVDCFRSQCICQDCFKVSDDTCSLRECRDYTRDGCQDDRRSQLTALLLSIFLSGVGAANFYIDRDGLAAGQLVLFLIILFSSCAVCFPLCCICCASDKEKTGLILSIYFCFITTLIILASLAQSAWWIADLVIFANNERDDGDGCMLRPI